MKFAVLMENPVDKRFIAMAIAAAFVLWLCAGETVARNADPAYCDNFSAALDQDVRSSQIQNAPRSAEIEQRLATERYAAVLNSCGANDPRVLDQILAKFPDTKEGTLRVAPMLASAPFPWASTQQDAWLGRLYDAYLNERDASNKVLLNAALMNAKGLYGEALKKFESAIANTEQHKAVLDGLQRSLKYSESPNFDDTRYLLGMFHLRNFVDEVLAAGPAGVNAGTSRELSAASRYFIDLAATPKGALPKHTMSAYWHAAVVAALRDDKAALKTNLDRLGELYGKEFAGDARLTWNHTLYYFRIFHHPALGRVNNHIPFDQLVEGMKAYLETKVANASPVVAAKDIEGLSARLMEQFAAARTYFLLVGTAPSRSSAEQRRTEIREKLRNRPALAEFLEKLQIYPPWGDRSSYSIGSPLNKLADTRAVLQTQFSQEQDLRVSLVRFY